MCLAPGHQESYSTEESPLPRLVLALNVCLLVHDWGQASRTQGPGWRRVDCLHTAGASLCTPGPAGPHLSPSYCCRAAGAHLHLRLRPGDEAARLIPGHPLQSQATLSSDPVLTFQAWKLLKVVEHQVMGLETEGVMNITKAIGVSSHPAGQGVTPRQQERLQVNTGWARPTPSLTCGWSPGTFPGVTAAALALGRQWAGGVQPGRVGGRAWGSMGLSMGRGGTGWGGGVPTPDATSNLMVTSSLCAHLAREGQAGTGDSRGEDAAPESRAPACF